MTLRPSSGATTRRPIASGAVWQAADVGAPATWTHALDEPTRAEIVAMTGRLRARGATIESIGRDAFDESIIDPLVSGRVHELRDGRGFLLIRGFPVEQLDPDDVELAYVALGARDAQRHAGVPRLTTDQLSAMELIEAIANDPRFYVEMDFQPGDIQLLNNSVILHSREAYEDASDPLQRRHLLRLWLAAHDFSVVQSVLREGIPARAHSQGSNRPSNSS